MSQQLKNLSKEDYSCVKSLGMLWEFHPEATGDWWEDCGKYQVKSSHDWLKEPKYKNLTILDPDGWNRSDYENSMNELITQGEFNTRVMRSTIELSAGDLIPQKQENVALVEFTD